MKKTPDKDLLPEYDFSTGVRGKYVARMGQGCNVVVLDKDVQTLFPDSAAVNTALRALGQVVAVARPMARPKRTVRKRAAA